MWALSIFIALLTVYLFYLMIVLFSNELPMQYFWLCILHAVCVVFSVVLTISIHLQILADIFTAKTRDMLKLIPTDCKYQREI